MEVVKKIVLMFQRLAKENKAEREGTTLEHETRNSLLLMRKFIVAEKLDVEKLTIITNSGIEQGDAVIAMMDIMSDPAKAAWKEKERNDKLQAKLEALERQVSVASDMPHSIAILSIIHREGPQSTGTLAQLMIGGIDASGKIYHRLKSCWDRDVPLVKRINDEDSPTNILYYDLTEEGRVELMTYQTD